MWWCESPITANKVDSISKLWQVSFSLNLLLHTWELSLGKSELEDKCGCTGQLSKAGVSLQPAICLEDGLGTLAHSSCGHSCSVGTLGKQQSPMEAEVAWVCALPSAAGAGPPLFSKPEKSSQNKAGGVSKASWEGWHPSLGGKRWRLSAASSRSHALMDPGKCLSGVV